MYVKIKSRKLLVGVIGLMVSITLFFLILSSDIDDGIITLLSLEKNVVSVIPNYFFYSYYGTGLMLILGFFLKISYQKLTQTTKVETPSSVNRILIAFSVIMFVIYFSTPSILFSVDKVIYTGMFTKDDVAYYDEFKIAYITANIEQHRTQQRKVGHYVCALEYQIDVPNFEHDITLKHAEHRKIKAIRSALNKSGVDTVVNVNILPPVNASGPDCNQEYLNNLKSVIENDLPVITG